MQLANTVYTHTQCILSCTAEGKQAARGREVALENRRWEGQREGRREGEGGGGRGREQGDGGRGNKGREGEKEGGSKVMVGNKGSDGEKEGGRE